MSEKKEYIQSKFELFVDLKYANEIFGDQLDKKQSAELENKMDNAFANVKINMGDNFVPFMDSLFAKLHDSNCDMGEREFETNEEFSICMNNMKTFGAELIDIMF